MEELRITASAELYYRITPARDHESFMPAEGKMPRPTPLLPLSPHGRVVGTGPWAVVSAYNPADVQEQQT